MHHLINTILYFTKTPLVCLFALITCTTFGVNAIQEHTNQKDKIVSVGGSVTEILFALGLEDQIVATDTSSLYPMAATKLPKVGYYRQLSAEGVLSTQARVLFAASGVGPSNVVEQLRQVGMQAHVFAQNKSVNGLYDLIVSIGKQAGKARQANELVEQLKAQLALVEGSAQHASFRPVFLMSANERGLMAAGADTVPNLVMQLAGTPNPFNDINGYKPISVEAFLHVSPSHVLLPAHQSAGRTPEQICLLPALSTWAAVNGCNVHIVDSLLFLGLGPRLPEAVSRFAEILQPHTAEKYSAKQANSTNQEQ